METKTKTKTKKIIRYNLPLNDVYDIVDSFNTGGLENAVCCDNCNRAIVNVAVIKNDKNKIFNVGVDCASTLNNLQNFYFLDLEFKELKSILAKVNKAKKENFEIKCEILKNGNLCAFYNFYDKHLRFEREIVLFNKDLEFSKKYLKSFLLVVSNPEKIGFEYKKIENIEPIEFFKKSENLDFKKQYKISGFDFLITVKPCFNSVTNEVSGYDLHLDAFKDNVNINSERITMFSNVPEYINRSMRNYYFQNYKN
jgi:hypothetical protein